MAEVSADQRIAQAVEAAKSGNKSEAKNLLAQVVRQEPHNARAWYLLSQVVDDRDQQIFCLEKVVEIQPLNDKAVKQLRGLKRGITQPVPQKPEARDLETKLDTYLEKEEKKEKEKNTNQLISIIVAVVIVGGCCILWSIFSGDDGEHEPDKTEAYVMCQQYVEERLTAPRSAKYPPTMDADIVNDDGVWGVVSYVDSQNSFGVMIRNWFYCRVQYLGERRWRLLELNFTE